MKEITERYLKLLEGITTEEWEEIRSEMNNKMRTNPVGGISINKAAEVMGKAPQFVRICLQQGILPFGYAVKTGNKNYNYYISPKLFYEYIGWRE